MCMCVSVCEGGGGITQFLLESVRPNPAPSLPRCSHEPLSRAQSKHLKASTDLCMLGYTAGTGVANAQQVVQCSKEVFFTNS